LSTIDSQSVIALPETWLCDTVDTLLAIPNYTLVSVPRPNRIGGGVGFYISNSLAYTIENYHTSCEILESVTIQIILTRDLSIIMTCVT